MLPNQTKQREWQEQTAQHQTDDFKIKSGGSFGLKATCRILTFVRRNPFKILANFKISSGSQSSDTSARHGNQAKGYLPDTYFVRRNPFKIPANSKTSSGSQRSDTSARDGDQEVVQLLSKGLTTYHTKLDFDAS